MRGAFRFILFKLLFSFYFTLFKPKGSLTCFSGYDGGGAQLQRILSVALIAEFYKINFLFTPISQIDFYPINLNKNDWINEWNGLINFREIYDTNVQTDLGIQSLFLTLIKIPWNNSIFALLDAHDFADTFTDFYDDLINNKRLLMNQNINVSHEVVIHLRKSIVDEAHPLYEFEKSKEISNIKFRNTLKIVFSDDYSNGISGKVFLAKNDFASNLLAKEFNNMVFDDSTNAINSIKEMSLAKKLVIGHSSMSYIAGLFNQNVVYYYGDFWHSPKSYWVNVE
jgi:hypothetical protein